MAKKKVFVISHSHWDREWYMAYEDHHMRLVQLIDDLFDLFENDPDFNSFHLDGQTIILDDYLAVRPEKRAELQHWIDAGKLRIGPFYILQDDFLISAEANARNAILGRRFSDKWGQPVPLGYYPDTFGNAGQVPQLSRLAGLDTVAFGRGVTPTGFNNTTGPLGDYDSTYSEMYWQSPDASKVLGILFANWYSNGNEIPADPAAAKHYWTEHLAAAEQYAATPDLLFMNGVDHQPVQKNLSQALAVARELFPDYEFIHSNFADYIAALKADLPADLTTVKGELTSQATSGWYTLANTASSRVYLKQQNTTTERLLENHAEPLMALSGLTEDSMQDRLTYAWQTLLQNDPHDSICGCSVDPVHKGMLDRYARAQEVGTWLTKTALTKLAGQIDTQDFPAASKPFLVINTAGAAKTAAATVTVEWARAPFSAGSPQQQYRKLEKIRQNLPALQVIDASGQVVPAHISDTVVRFNYDLPDRAFRVPYMGLYITVTLPVTVPAFSWQGYALTTGEAGQDMVTEDHGTTLHNKALTVALAADGTVTMNGTKLVFTDTGDIGNEYIYKAAENDQPIPAGPARNIVRTNRNGIQTLAYDQTPTIPVAADAQLAMEQQSVTDITQRHAVRGGETAELVLHVVLTLAGESRQLQIHLTGDNQMRDHRIQARFVTGIQSDHHQAESIFEAVTRPNTPGKAWRNPEDPQHQQAFVDLSDDQVGVTIGNFGLNEYQIEQKTGTIAVTLLRCVGEMGDWGYFPTPDAQCQGPFHADLTFQTHTAAAADTQAAWQLARAGQIGLTTVQLPAAQMGTLPNANTYLTVDNPAFAVTALHVSPASGDLLVRGYNLTDVPQTVAISYRGALPTDVVDFLEHPLPAKPADPLRPAEIRTYRFRKD